MLLGQALLQHVAEDESGPGVELVVVQFNTCEV